MRKRPDRCSVEFLREEGWSSFHALTAYQKASKIAYRFFWPCRHRKVMSIALNDASILRLRGSDRALLVWMTRLWPSLLGAVQVVQPETVLRWHRAGFKMFWRWKSRNRAGQPRIDRGLRDLIQRMSRENPLWGASRIHGELLMLGFEVAQSTVSKYMVRRRNPPSQPWKTFLRNHAEAIAAIDMCVVPTLTFDLLFAFLVLGHGRPCPWRWS
jgi:hypothetical protein